MQMKVTNSSRHRPYTSGEIAKVMEDMPGRAKQATTKKPSQAHCSCRSIWPRLLREAMSPGMPDLWTCIINPTA